MSKNADSIRLQFNRRADSYDKHAHIQRLMADRLTKSLRDRVNVNQLSKLRILEIGCGTGALTEKLAAEWPDASITAIDLSPAMLKAAEQRLKSCANCSTSIQFLQADVERWASDAFGSTFDLIVSNACFQWLKDPSQTLLNLHRLLHGDGLLAFTTFGPDTFRELHQSFDDVYRANGLETQRHGLSFQTFAQWQHLLIEAGFTSLLHSEFAHTETHATPRDFLHAVKAIGASTSEAGGISRIISARNLFSNMYRVYLDKFSVPGGVAATYDILLMHAQASSINAR